MADKKISSDKKEKQSENMSFEEAMARLEEIVRSLEGGTAQLDSSLAMSSLSASATVSLTMRSAE